MMEYYDQITFPTIKRNSDQISVLLRIVNPFGGLNKYLSNEKGLSITKYGAIDIDFDLEDLFLLPSELQMSFSDPEQYLYGRLINHPSQENIYIDIYVEININGETKFKGYSKDDGINYNDDRKEISISFAPQLDIINRKMVYNENNEPTDPLKHGSAGHTSVIGVIQDIYQIINPEISYPNSLKVNHEWEFRGHNVSEARVTVDGFKLTDIAINTKELFWDNSKGVRTLGDVLRKIAIDWGAFTGMIHQGKAIFHKLYFFDGNNTQELKVLSHKISFPYQMIRYVKTTDDINTYTSGTFTEMEGDYLERNLLSFCRAENTEAPFGDAGTNLFVLENGQISHYIYKVKDKSISNDWKDYGKLVADYWLYYRSNRAFARVDEFLVSGINYDFLKNFVYDNKKFQIIGMKINLDKLHTTIRAIHLGGI